MTHTPESRYRLLREVAEILARPLDAGSMAREVFAKLAESLPDIDVQLTLANAAGPTHGSPDVRAFYAHPLAAVGRPIGTISFASRVRDAFDAATIDVFRTIALLLAGALDRIGQLERLESADRRKDEFLATLAHELRNPLAPIRNALEILRIAGQDDRAAQEARNMLDRQVAQVIRLVDDLREVSRISRGRLRLRVEDVDLPEVVRSAVEVSRTRIAERGHELHVESPPGRMPVRGDGARLIQVFTNLLDNASKYTERGGRIHVRVAASDGEAVVSVRDTGVGIPAAMLPHIFEMFTQVDRTLERAQGGLGIGLGVVERLVSMHGGRVEARSDGADAGSEFLVRLPLLAEGRESRVPDDALAEEQIAPARGPRRVLVADDDPDTVTSLALVLQLRGDDVRTARHGSEAVEIASRFRPDVVLLDIGMPVLNGYDACRRIREQAWGRDAVLVALTGFSQPADRRRAEEAGFDRHLVKPVEPDLLGRLLDELSM